MKPEFRICPVTGRTVILAPERAARPVALEHFAPHHRDESQSSFCPFCPGNEWDTPGEVYEICDEAGWQLRVVPNKFPAVRDALGQHEVVIECREHLANPTQLSDEQLANVFIAYRERMKALLADPRIKSVTAFKNVGAEAGASLPHLHSQLLATPFVPEALQVELNGAKNYFDRTGRNLFLDMLDNDERTIHRGDGWATICPNAPRFAYEMWIMPMDPQPCFQMISDGDCGRLAIGVKSMLRTLDDVLDAPAYNWLIHSAPNAESYYQWHLEILPRTARPAGYEWATGVFINAVPPEQAAKELRQALERG